eukprot:Awhi_evm1s5144
MCNMGEKCAKVTEEEWAGANKANVYCFKCYSLDHVVSNCPKKSKKECGICGDVGHKSAECHKPI